MQDLLLHFGTCRQGSRPAGLAPQASAVASTLGKGVLAGKHGYPLVASALLLPEDSGGEEVY